MYPPRDRQRSVSSSLHQIAEDAPPQRQESLRLWGNIPMAKRPLILRTILRQVEWHEDKQRCNRCWSVWRLQNQCSEFRNSKLKLKYKCVRYWKRTWSKILSMLHSKRCHAIQLQTGRRSTQSEVCLADWAGVLVLLLGIQTSDRRSI